MVLLDKYGFVLPYKTSEMNFNLPILNNFNTNLDFYPYGNKVLSENVENCIKWLNQIKINFLNELSRICPNIDINLV